jgi:signal transduction histidine kinase
MFVLYAFLLMHIKRSENIINDQSKETQERNRMLEYLTAKMINAQEDERRRIAYDLHEDVVQTISGVKMQLERYIASLTEDKAAQVDADVTESIVPVLQEAAQKIRMVAIDLRPPSLDDFGLKAAINTLMTECRALKTEMAMTFDVRINESDLTTERRSILYRMLKDALKSLCSKYIARGTVKITLDMLENRLILVFNVTGLNDQDLGPETIPVYLESVQERTILSGGQFDLKRIGSAIESVSSWHV